MDLLSRSNAGGYGQDLRQQLMTGILDPASQNAVNIRMLVTSGLHKDASTLLLQYSHTGQVHGLIHLTRTTMADKTDKTYTLLSLLRKLGTVCRSVLLLLGAITYKAYEDGKAEGIFKYFIDTMLDGGDIQVAWEYGAKGTHWDDKEETVYSLQLKGKDDEKKAQTYTAKEGEFH